MSDINLDFTVSNNEITFTVEPNEITFTPSDIQLTINPAFTPVAGGVDGDVQFNSGGNLVGYPTFKFYYLTNTLSVTNLIANASNFTSNIGNIHITGGINGYFLQTDGLGNLNWSAAGGGGNGSPGGSNTQIQFNDSGLFGGNTGFTFNKTNGNLDIPGNLNVVGNISGSFSSNYANYAGNIVNNAQPNITSVGTLTDLTVANIINGTANFATSAGTVTTNSQPNITSLGTLGNLIVSNNTTTANINITQIANVVTGIENLTVIGAQTGVYNLDVLTSPIRYSTGNATANLTLNIRGNSTTTLNSILGNGQSITVTYVMTTGATAYGITSFRIDNSTVTPKFAGTSTSSSNSTVAYTYTIIKNSGIFTALGSVSRYQ